MEFNPGIKNWFNTKKKIINVINHSIRITSSYQLMQKKALEKFNICS